MGLSRRPKPKPVKPVKAADTRLRPAKQRTSVLDHAQRMLVKDSFDDNRSWEYVHPSDLSKSNYCIRKMVYGRLGYEPEPRQFQPGSLQVFEEGHSIHDKWQKWMWRLGHLTGMFRCIVCGHRWMSTSPEKCPECDVPAFHGKDIAFLRYDEVPVVDEKHGIRGKADAIYKSAVVEIKSVGPGTVRFEDPGLWNKAREEGWDTHRMWGAIGHPFPTHIRQGTIYARILGLNEIIFIYEWKPTSGVKEFALLPRFQSLDERFDDCLDVTYWAQKGKVPRRPRWAEHPKKTQECKDCPYNQRCWSEHGDKETEAEEREKRVSVRKLKRQRPGSSARRAGSGSSSSSTA